MTKIIKTIFILIFWFVAFLLTEKLILVKLAGSTIEGIITIILILSYIPISIIAVNYIFNYIKKDNTESPKIFTTFSIIILLILLKITETFIVDRIPDTPIVSILTIFSVIIIFIPLSIAITNFIFKLIKK